MNTSIVLKGEYSIGLDKTGKFEFEGKAINIKEVPYVRYRFEEYTESAIQYIKKMKLIFKYSAHMAEIAVKPGVREVMDNLSNSIDNLIIYLYVPVTDINVTEGLSDDMLELLKEINGGIYDRIMLKDNSSMLHMVSANNIKKQISNVTGFSQMDMGICQSPLSFNGEACLTAVKARELSAMYSENDEAALPSANHECMHTCGCIRYIEIVSNIKAPILPIRSSNNGGKSSKSSGKKVSSKVLPRFGK